jgi:hypothetical protein
MNQAKDEPLDLHSNQKLCLILNHCETESILVQTW